MENFSVNEVSDLLREHKMPEQLVEILADNHIDGVALFALPEDFDEFKCLVPQSGLRLRLKALLRNLCDPFNTSRPSTSLGSTGELVTSSMAVINRSSNIDFQHDIPMAYDDPIQPAHYDDDDANNDDETISTKRQKFDLEVEKKHKLQAIEQIRLPNPCPLPNNFSMVTTKAIENNTLKGNIRLRMTREAAAFYYGICPKPTPTEYTIMAKTLCDNYPQLKDKDPNKNYWETVKLYLSQRYRNSRRDSDPVSVEVSKKKLVTISHALIPATDFSEDMDIVAYERNNKSMLTLYNSRSFNPNEFHKLLKLTYKIRRSKVNSSSLTISAIKEEYPYFANAKWVNAEFNFMFGEDTPERMATNWNKILPAVLKFGGEKVPEEFTQHSTYKAIEIIDKAFRSSGATAKSDPAFVMYELGTNIQSVLKEKSFAEPKLVIFTNQADKECKAQGFVLAEKAMLFEIPEFTVLGGLTSLLAAYYIFDVSYPKSFAAANFLLFTQEYILESRDRKAKHSVRYNEFINNIIDV